MEKHNNEGESQGEEYWMGKVAEVGGMAVYYGNEEQGTANVIEEVMHTNSKEKEYWMVEVRRGV